MLAAGSPRREILASLVAAAERVAGPDTVASILLLDEDGLLRNGASPSLPADYLDAIDRLKPDPAVGTCAAAAATGVVVLTPDFLADDKWAELRHLPMSLGFAGAWSMPIKSSDGTVLGKVSHLFSTGANDVLVVRGDRERLLPYTGDAIRRVDLAAGVIEVDWDPDF